MNVKRPSAVFLHRFYWPDVAAAGQMLTDLAEDLAARGWQVTVVVSRTRYEAGLEVQLPAEEVHNGVRIVRVKTTRFGRGRLVARLGDHASYLGGALLRLLRLPRPDLVVAMSEPPLLLGVALLGARLRGAATVYWVQDVYPHLAGKLGVLSERGLPYRAIAWLTRRMHAACDAVITLGPRMAEVLVGSGARPERVSFVHNWADAAAVRPLPPAENPFVRDNGLEGKFVVLYSGNAGRAHTFDAVVEAMRRLRDHPDVRFLFIGGGNRLGEIRAAAERERLSNVRFMDYVPRSELAGSLSAASVSLVTEMPEVVGLLVPSKTYGIMASGRPLLFIGSERSDVARIVRETGCGEVVPPDDADALVGAILRLRDAPAEAAAMGARGRRAVEEEYDRRRGTRHWAEIVERMLAERQDHQGAVPAAGEVGSFSRARS